MKQLILIVSIALLSFKVSAQANVIASKDAGKHINENVTVTGKIFGSKYFAANNMVLLDMDGYNPNQKLTIMISAAHDGKFKDKPEEFYKGKDITVTGTVISYKDKPEIAVTDPMQIKVVMSDNLVKPAFSIKN
jgi:DNA/RNA endonuclease YhcR with UshA esterase domain